MLACAQDIFFTSDTVNQNNISDPFLDSQQSKDSKRSRMKHSNTMHHLQHHLKHEHIANKHKEEVGLNTHIYTISYFRKSNRFGHQMLKQHLLKVNTLYSLLILFINHLFSLGDDS